MRYLLDTAVFSNNATMPQVLPERIRRLLNTDEVKGLCGVSLLELAIHHRLGRLKLRGSLTDFFNLALAQDLEVLDITPEIAAATNLFSDTFPGDPFDRTIAATARVLKLTLITPDPEIKKASDSGFCEVEYYPFKAGRAS